MVIARSILAMANRHRATPGRLCCAAIGVLIVVLAGLGPTRASSLIYTPINPSFGGNPNNGAVLLNEANAQNLPLAASQATAAAISAAASAAAATSSSSTQSAGSIFAQELQSQLLSSFANQITQAIFGPNAQTSGTFSYGTTTINFNKVGTNIDISINDGVTITNIVVPSLQ